MNYKIGIVGFGYVGKAVYDFFGGKENENMVIYDPFVESTNKKEHFINVDLAVICVMTKEKENGSCDTSIVEESVKWLNEVNKDIIILVKSAIVPREAERIKEKYNARLVVSPEYVGESKYFTPYWKYPDPRDMKKHNFHIFGGDKKDTSECVSIFQEVAGPSASYYQTDLKTAALCKYMENSWGAMKVTFCNEWYSIAKAHGVDYNELRELWTADSRVEKMHTVVFPKKRGYGGKCFPKDVKAIISECLDLGFIPEVMINVDKVNTKLRKINE